MMLVGTLITLISRYLEVIFLHLRNLVYCPSKESGTLMDRLLPMSCIGCGLESRIASCKAIASAFNSSGRSAVSSLGDGGGGGEGGRSFPCLFFSGCPPFPDPEDISPWIVMPLV